nr:MAG: ORF1 [TTV-like mini virus]
MPPFYRRRYYRRNYWNYGKRRKYFRRRRPTKTFRRKRRYRRVRKTKFSKFTKKKLKTLIMRQWQPSYIRKCTIKGYLLLFEAGHGHFGNNFVPYKETFTPHGEPGGGGWGIQELSLSNLFTQNQYLMNIWTHSNGGLNLVRYQGCKITLYRQPETDYIFTYFNEEPTRAGRYWYPSFQPMKMILYKNKVSVPSYQTQPNNRKTYKRIYIKPPKLIRNNWYFQQHLSPFPLLRFAATACSFQHMFLSSKATNSNITVKMLNTRFFLRSAFQYTTPQEGYFPKEQVYIYGLENGYINITSILRKNVIYLGGPYMDEGTPVGTNGWGTSYPKTNWGNVFYYKFFQNIQTVFLHTEKPEVFLSSAKVNTAIGTVTLKNEPFFSEVRYNPYKDKGTGNRAYWKSVSDATNNNWDPPKDPDSIIEGYPFWLMLWGWEEYTKKLGKLKNLDNDYILVLRSSYFSEGYPAYVPLGDSFVDGQAPFRNEPEYITAYDRQHWFPKWKFQREAIDNILMSGPGTCKAENTQSIQAFMKYQFFFKWGGNSSTLETIADPNSQPLGPDPNNQFISNEIIDPETSIENILYKWDIRRDQLTQAATKRIKECSTHDQYVFTDGTTPQASKTSPSQEETTPQEEIQTLLQQLNQLQQFNRDLQHRFLRLKQLTMDT